MTHGLNDGESASRYIPERKESNMCRALQHNLTAAQADMTAAAAAPGAAIAPECKSLMLSLIS